MKHVIMGSAWNFSTEPFDKFETSLVYGRNKRDRTFLPTKVKPSEKGTLPEGFFKVITTRDKGTVLIVPGSDTSKKVLLFADVSGGFRGGVRKLESTTAKVIKECSAAAACESGYSFAAVINPGEYVDVYSYGRRTDDVHRFANVNGEIVKTVMSHGEWKLLQTPEEEEGEEI